MAYTNIDDPSAYFQVKLWTGNATAGNTITLDGNSDMQPDWMWHKEPTDTNGWHQMDSSRGPTYVLASQSTTAEYDVLNSYISSFNSNGFTAGSGDSSINSNGVSQCSWMWHCNGGTTSSNTDGSITSTVQANQDAGFSIVTWTGNESASATVGHGLGVTPKVVMIKSRSGAYSWNVYLGALPQTGGNNMFCFLDTDSSAFQVAGTAFNSSTFQPTGNVKRNAGSMVAYCFADIQGYSKFGSYVGNGSTNGPFVYTGFKPALIITKNADATDSWNLLDNKRSPYNVADKYLQADNANAEGTYTFYDILSNGFKIRNTGNANISGNTITYIAWAENPFVTSTGVPTTAR